MQMTTQKCLDGKTLIIGPSLLTQGVQHALSEIKGCSINDIDDILCTQLALDDWSDIKTSDQQIIYAIIANVYSTLISDPDEFIELSAQDGVGLGYDNGLFYPAEVPTYVMNSTFFKADV